MPSLTEIAALLSGPVGVGIGVAVRDYLKRRQEAAIAAESARTETERAKVAVGAAERIDAIALLREQIAAGEMRGEKSAARADAMADALRAVAEQTRALSDAVDDLRDAVTEHAHREEMILASLDARLSLLTPPPSATGEQPRASVVPDPPRPPAPAVTTRHRIVRPPEPDESTAGHPDGTRGAL